ncbi:BON domain-containing protein [Methylicorpusculum oleiharenae]|uniref:BON domain-containing protein n=1 Tax=Methylicorpusculum oleiharenae TaxID=1338687 RepID=UPI001356BF38|nr:BON domain-containing protein [Methylicorpusculum oleiharenae]MCD2450392.1 BON domain-containing protein [Methylicorpusculum oleiharenae]
MKKINEQRINRANSILVTLLLSAVIITSGCKEEGPAEKTGKKLDQAIENSNEIIDEKVDALKQSIDTKEEAMEKQSETVGELIDDAAITAKAKAAMMTDPLVNAFNIDVATVQGVVKLNGAVTNQQIIDRVLEIVRATPGVKSVENHLVVSTGDLR